MPLLNGCSCSRGPSRTIAPVVETTYTYSVWPAEGGGGLAEQRPLKRQCSAADANKWRLSGAEQLISDRARQQRRRGKHTPPPDSSAAKQQTPRPLILLLRLLLRGHHTRRRCDGSRTLRTCQDAGSPRTRPSRGRELRARGGQMFARLAVGEVRTAGMSVAPL